MKFRFCGDLEPPDWILSEITLLSKMTSLNIQNLCNGIVTYILDGDDIDYKSVLEELNLVGLDKLSDVKASIAVLDFIIREAAKHDVDPISLSLEIQQLGLPKENSDALTECYQEKKESLRESFANKSFKFPSLKNLHWRVDFLLSSKNIKHLNIPSVQLCLEIEDESNLIKEKKEDIKENKVNSLEKVLIEINPSKFRVLYQELLIAKRILDSIDT